MAIALNVVLFQLGWVACILGAAHAMAWVSVVAAGAITAWHLSRATHPRCELALVVVAVLLGLIFETFLVQAGLVRFETGVLIAGAAPYWMVALWAIFATTVNVSLRWLRPRLWLAALLGAVGGPPAYYAGARLGALEFIAAGAALVAIAIGWAILLPALLAAARRLDASAQT
jgi:hypothetical protein